MQELVVLPIPMVHPCPRGVLETPTKGTEIVSLCVGECHTDSTTVHHGLEQWQRGIVNVIINVLVILIVKDRIVVLIAMS